MRRKTTGILAYFKRHNDGFAAKVGYSRAHETYARYRVVCRHLTSYIQKKYRRDDIPLSSIRTPFVEGFDTWLRTACGLSSNSVWGYMMAKACSPSTPSPPTSTAIRPWTAAICRKRNWSG